MLKTSHQITLGDGTKDRRKTSLSVWHCLTSPGTGVCFNNKFPNATHSCQRLAGSPTLYKLISNLLHPSSSISYTPTIPTPLLSSRWFVSCSERKKKLTFFNLSLKYTPVYSYPHLRALSALVKVREVLVFPVVRPICFHSLGKLHYQLSFFLHLQCFPFN